MKVKRPPLPCCTRWGTTTAALAYYNLRWAYTAQAAASHLLPGHLVRRTLETPGTSRSVLDFQNMLVVPTDAVFMLEKTTTTIAHTVEVLLETISRSLALGGHRSPAYAILKEHSQRPLGHPAFLASNLLDPRYHGQAVPDNQREIAVQWLHGYNVGRALTGYLAKAGSCTLPCHLLPSDSTL